jgi:hypothetical protein
MLGRLTKQIVQELADILGDSLGWSVDQKNAEVDRALHLLTHKHGVGF